MDDEDDKEARLRRKQAFYAGLDVPTDSDDDAPDPGRQGSVQAMRKTTAPRRSPPSANPRNDNALLRSASDTQVIGRKKHEALRRPRTEEGPNPSSSSKAAAPPVSTRKTVSGNPSKSMAVNVPAPLKATGKRKRTTEIKQVPEAQQIFKSLHFYFFPNNDTNPARKMRIAKALEFGAIWQKNLDDAVTHVIVDKALDYSQLLKYLKRSSLPEHVIVVSENYPAECISFRTLLNARQLQFKVKGLDVIPATRPSSSSSDRSLLLKSAGKAVLAGQSETQPEQRNSSPAASSESADETGTGSARRQPRYESTVTANSNIKSTEEFDAAVRQARELQDVPLDNDHEPASRPSSSEGPPTDSDQEQTKHLTLANKDKLKMQRWQDKFQCMQKHTGSNTATPNASTIAILQQMVNFYDQTGDQWRVRAYRNAMATLRNHSTKVWTRGTFIEHKPLLRRIRVI